MLPGYTLLRAYFYDQNRNTINCELQDLETDQIIQYTIPNDNDNAEYKQLLETYSVDNLHEETFKYIRRSQTEIKRVAIEVAKRNGWLLSDVTVEDDIAEQDEYKNQIPSDEWIRQKEREFADREKQLKALQESVYADRDDVKARRARLEEKQKRNEKEREEIAAKKKELESRREKVLETQQLLASKQQQLASKQQQLASKDEKLSSQEQETRTWQENLKFKERQLTSKEQEVSAQEYVAPSIEEVLLTYVFNTNVNPEYIFNLKLKLFDMDFIKTCKDRTLKKELRVAKTVDEVVKAAINLFQYEEPSAEN
jgi:chromosome segregation ATPase